MYTIDIEMDSITNAYARLVKALNNSSPLMHRVAKDMRDAVEEICAAGAAQVAGLKTACQSQAQGRHDFAGYGTVG